MRENTQPALPAEISSQILLHSTFETIQGEGPFCGERALFIRLYGCNLRCPGCDTDYTSKGTVVSPDYFAKMAQRNLWPQGALVVITGGEPFRQKIAPMIVSLLEAGYRVQIETNGVLWPDGMDDVWARALLAGKDAFTIVCSPKTQRIHPRVYATAAAFKYVLRKGEIDETDGLPIRALQHKATPHVARPRPGALVFVQPMDEGEPAANALNLDAAVRSVMTFGHRLQIQVHKIINME